MLIRITNSVLRASFWLLTGVVVLVALYLLLGRAFVYSMAADNKGIEALLNRGGLQNVMIGNAVGDWKVFDPVFRLSDIKLVRGREGIVRLGSLRVRFDSFRSMISRSPVVAEIEVIGVNFTIVVDANGVGVKGLVPGGRDFNLDWLLDNITHVNRVKLSDVDITVEGPDYQAHIRSQEGAPWQISGNSAMKVVMLPVYMVREHQTEIIESRLNLTGQYSGDIRADDFFAKLYLTVPAFDLANYLPDAGIGNHLINRANLSSDVWMDVKPNQVSLTGGLRLSSVLSQRGTLLDKGILQFRYEGPTLSIGSISIPVVELIQGDMNYRVTDISAALEIGSESIAVAAEVPLIDVGNLAELLQFAGDKELVPRRLSSALSDLNPRGQLQDVTFLIDRSRGQPLIAGRLVGFSIDAYMGVPSIEPLNGFLMARPTRGYLDIDNDAFVMKFSNMFTESWPFDSGRGRVTYELSEGELNLESGLIELSHGELEAFGKVVVNLPSVRDLHSWGLTIGVNNAKLLDSQKFLPKMMSEAMVDWLKAGISAGTSDETGLTFHGALFRGSAKVRKAHDLFFKISDSQLNYHQDWPPVSQVHGTLHINNHFVRSSDLIGKVYDTSVEQAKLQMPIDAHGRANTILVNASSVGPLSDLIRTLNETPLSNTTANVAELWHGSGEILADIALNVPIGDRTDQGVATEVKTYFEGAHLRMPELDVSVDELSGVAEFSTKDGLSADGFSGVSFGKPIEGSIGTDIYDNGGEIVITLNGAISTKSLYEWSDLVLLSRAEGMLDYTAAVHVPYGDAADEAHVEAHSNLVGMCMDLPYPLGKHDDEESRQFQYRHYFRQDGNRIDMTLDENIHASLKVIDSIAVGGLIYFGNEPLGDVGYDQVRMTGQLDYLNVKNWLNAIDELSADTDISLDNEIATHVESAVLSIDKLLLYELELEDSRAKITRDDAAWLTSLDSEMLKGEIKVADADNLPIEIRLDRFRIDDSDNGADSLGDGWPFEIDAINFSTDSLIVDDEDYGSWAFHYRVDGEIARFEEFQAALAGLRVLDSSALEWRSMNGLHSTRFKGNVEVDDLATAMRKFGFASSIEGQGIKINADVVWAGSPAMVDLERLVGDVGLLEGEGRFVQAEAGGALKLLGIFDFASIARRLRLDFSDVVEKGFEFTEITGSTAFDQGHIRLTHPIVIEGSTARFTVGGEVDLTEGTLDNEMIVTLPVARTLPWYAAISAGPISGIGVMVAQKVFKSQMDQIDRFGSAKYRVSGSIDKPRIEFVSPFANKLGETGGENNETRP